MVILMARAKIEMITNIIDIVAMVLIMVNYRIERTGERTGVATISHRERGFHS